MLDLKLRDEFRGKKLKGTTIDFTNQSKTGALEVSAAEFLKITYPSHDLLKTIEATGPNQSRPVVLLGGRGQGKSHLLAALYHLCTNPEAGRQWLTEWAGNLGNQLLGNLKLRSESCVIAESLHLNRFTFLWDVLFNRHPHGAYCRGMWESVGPEKKTEVPSDLILIEMFRKQPTVLILDEFQTWFDGQTNTKQYPRKKWAFNFIQVLSEIAQTNPELLVLVVSVRENESEAYQQIHRVNPALVDFKGPQAKRDRQRLLLYRIFENRMQVPSSKIATLVQPHISEYFRLAKVPQPEQERRHDDFIEAWPFSPLLLKLLDDQVLIATSAQETRDLIKILVDLFKNTDSKSPIITAADFRLNSENSVVASLLDSVSNQLHKDLREKAQRNLQAVMDAVHNAKTVLPHCEEIISALWLRSLTVDRLVGADPAELQIDITRAKPIDDNQFAGELASIEENSFNIHRIGIRLVFKNEENPQAKLLAHAKNDKLFQHDEDIDHLAKEIRACISGPEHVSQLYRVVVLKKKWQSNPWSEFDEKEHPKNWDARLPMVVMPESPEKIEAALGNWLKTHLQEGRNTIRFLLPQRGTGNVYYDRELLILARAIYLAMQWSETDPVYRPLKTKFQNELTGKLKNRFDRFAVLDIWNFGEPAKCKFEERSHGAQGDKIPETVDKIIKQDVFIPEEFETFVLKLAEGTESVGKLLKDLREPRPSGNPCIPWLGEVEVKERVIKMCAAGQIAINVRGHDLLQARPGETYDDAWNRMKGKLGTGKHLDETPMYMPDAVVDSGGKPPTIVVPGNTPFFPGPVTNPGVTVPATITGNDVGPTNLFDGQGVTNTTKIPCSAPPTSGLNLLGQIEGWQIGPASQVTNVSLRTSKLTKGQLDALLKLFGDGVSSVSVNLQAMTGSQLQQLLKHLPDGVTYGLDLEKEAT